MINKKTALILGKSNKFIKIIKNYYKFNKITILGWREIKLKKIKNKFNYIFVCGFDYRSFNNNLNTFKQKNIFHPYKQIKLSANKYTKIIYIDTFGSSKFTFSRYEYAKKYLGYLISKNFKNKYIFSCDVIKHNNSILIYGNFFYKLVFRILIFLKIVKSVELKDIFEMDNVDIKYIPKPKFLKFSRSLFIDRLLRLLSI